MLGLWGHRVKGLEGYCYKLEAMVHRLYAISKVIGYMQSVTGHKLYRL